MRSCAKRMRELWPDVRFSSVYRTAPQGFIGQDDFLNAAAEIETDLAPEELRLELVSIEQDFQKEVPYKDGPRTIDLDLLLFENAIIQTKNLSVPHPRMHIRRFALEPLVELIDMDSKHPILQETWGALLKKTLEQPCTLTHITL